MTLPDPVAAAAAHTPFPFTTTARALQPIGITLLVALLSYLSLVALIRGVLATGGGISLLIGVLAVAAVTLVLTCRLLFRLLGSRRGWPTAILIAVADLVVYFALFVTGTQTPSIVSLRPEVVIAAVALATGAASAIGTAGWWRALGVVGVLGLAWLALTPVIVAL